MGQVCQQPFGFYLIAASERCKGQQHRCIGLQVMSFFSYQAQSRNARLAIRLRAVQPQKQANGRRFQAQQIVLDANRQVGIVAIRIFRQQRVCLISTFLDLIQ